MNALVYGNGDLLNPEVFQRLLSTLNRPSDRIIAADGGAFNLASHDTLPDIIIGDLDSFTEDAPEGVELIHDPDQETNDLQKALNKARDLGAETVVITGVIGDRMDHNLNNLSVLLEYSSCFATLSCVDNWGSHRCVGGESPSFRCTLRPGQTVSLYPLSGRVEGVRTTGLRYPLNGETLEPGVRTGCLNEAVAEQLSVWLSSGSLLLSVAHAE